jgi:hypothetical protein
MLLLAGREVRELHHLSLVLRLLMLAVAVALVTLELVVWGVLVAAVLVDAT